MPVYLEMGGPSTIKRDKNICEHQRTVPAEGGRNSARKLASFTQNEIRPLPFPAVSKASAHLENQIVSKGSWSMLRAESEAELKCIESFCQKNNRIEDMKAASKDYSQEASFQFDSAPGEDKLGTNLQVERPIAVALAPVKLFLPTSDPATHFPVARPIPIIHPKSSEDKHFYTFSSLKRQWAALNYRILNGIKTSLSVSKRFIRASLRPLGKLSLSGTRPVGVGVLRVPMFFAELEFIQHSKVRIVSVYLAIICLLFGCAHLIPSFFIYYPSRTEMWLWRISTGIIVAQPPIFLTIIGLVYIPCSLGYPDPIKCHATPIRRAIRTACMRINKLVIVGGAPFYVIARITLIILAFLSLRQLPDDAYFTIDWISSIPHL